MSEKIDLENITADKFNQLTLNQLFDVVESGIIKFLEFAKNPIVKIGMNDFYAKLIKEMKKRVEMLNQRIKSLERAITTQNVNPFEFGEYEENLIGFSIGLTKNTLAEVFLLAHDEQEAIDLYHQMIKRVIRTQRLSEVLEEKDSIKEKEKMIKDLINEKHIFEAFDGRLTSTIGGEPWKYYLKHLLERM